MTYQIDEGTVQILDKLLRNVTVRKSGFRTITEYAQADDPNGETWIISDPKSYQHGIWHFQHESVETQPDGEGGMEATSGLHGMASGLLDAIWQIEEMAKAHTKESEAA